MFYSKLVSYQFVNGQIEVVWQVLYFNWLWMLLILNIDISARLGLRNHSSETSNRTRTSCLASQELNPYTLLLLWLSFPFHINFKFYFDTERKDGADSPSPDCWALTQVRDTPTTPERGKKSPHPNVDTWIMGSPHDSDEYDTDLETDMLKSKNFINLLLAMNSLVYWVISYLTVSNRKQI